MPGPAGLADGEVGPVEEAVVEFAATLPLEPGDVRAPLIAAAVRVAREVDRQGAPGHCRELSNLLDHAGEFGRSVDELDEIRTRRAQRRVALLLDGIA